MIDREENGEFRRIQKKGKENEQIIDQLQCRQGQKPMWSVTVMPVGAL